MFFQEDLTFEVVYDKRLDFLVHRRVRKGKKENKVLITIGNQICDPNVFENKTEAKKYISKKPWMLIATTSLILSQNVNRGGKE